MIYIYVEFTRILINKRWKQRLITSCLYSTPALVSRCTPARDKPNPNPACELSGLYLLRESVLGQVPILRVHSKKKNNNQLGPRFCHPQYSALNNTVNPQNTTVASALWDFDPWRVPLTSSWLGFDLWKVAFRHWPSHLNPGETAFASAGRNNLKKGNKWPLCSAYLRFSHIQSTR